MGGKVDLHVHSSASDGRFSPAEIVQQAAGRGLAVMALTDHDTVDGIPAALEESEKYPDLLVIPGVEISTEVPAGEVHILGYCIDYTDPLLKIRLEQMRHSRLERARKMVSRLCQIGCNIEWCRVQEIAGDGTVGRPHIAQALLEKGHIGSMKEAFAKYIGSGCQAYVPREKITPGEAVKLILMVGGLPVLAHPFTVDNHEALVDELQEIGLAGIECYYDSYAPEEVNSLLRMADRHGLIATGGSDYHGLDTSEALLGLNDIPLQAAEKLVLRARQQYKNGKA